MVLSVQIRVHTHKAPHAYTVINHPVDSDQPRWDKGKAQ